MFGVSQGRGFRPFVSPRIRDSLSSVKKVMFSSVSVCLLVRSQDYAESFQTMFVKPRRIVYYCYGKNPLHFVVDPIHNG